MPAQPVNRRPRKNALGGVRLRLIGMILVSVVPLIAGRAVVMYHERQQEIDAAGVKALEIAQQGAARYRETLVEAQTLLQLAAQSSEVVNGSPQNCAAFLQRAGRGRDWADGFWVFSADGRAICTTFPSGIGLDVSDREYFRHVIEKREFVVSDFFTSALRQVPISLAALPALNQNGEVARVLAVTLQLGWLARVAAEIGVRFDAIVLLLDGSGRLMARYPEQPEHIGKDFENAELLKDVLANSEGSSEVAARDGGRRIYGFVQIPGTQARIVVGFDRAKVLARIDAQITRAALFTSAVLLLAMLMSLALARSIARPLKILTQGADAARRSQDAILPAISGYAEVESLAASLNELLADRRARERALNAARAEAERAVEEARAAHMRLLDAIEAVPGGLVFFDAEDRYVLWNRRYEEMYSRHETPIVCGLRYEDRLRAGLACGQYAEASGHEEEWLSRRLALHRAAQSSDELKLPGDRWVQIDERRTGDGGSIGIRIDITESKRRERSFRFLFDSNPVPMWVNDRENLRFLAVNEAAIAHYGYSREQFLAMTILDIRDPEYHVLARKMAAQETDSLGERTWRHRRADGSEVQMCIYSRPLVYEGRPAKLAALIDVTERRRDEARITHMAHHDGLTDLANRALFRERLEKGLALQREPGLGIALHCIDLDNFKDINDTLGHPTGDVLLRLVAERLRNCVREQDVAARIGGDEFAVIQHGITGPEDARSLAQRLIDGLSAPYDMDGHEVLVSASVGIATSLDDQQGPDKLLNHADIALYRAKAKGHRSHCFFQPEMDAELKARRALEIHLRSAFNGKEFELHYQPLINLDTRQIDGFEALLRWTHPERGAISPSEFIPLAEEVGLIVPLGEWVLRQGCADAVKWPDHVMIAINLSPLQFKSGHLVETVRAALASTGLPPYRLELEITETVMFKDDDVNLAILHDLRRLGVRIAMDDFGAGYSSLSYLRRFPFNKIKIDRSFVRELPHNSDCLTITRGIVELANGLGMTTTAEGVETPEQLYVLQANGCNQAQGFLFGAARPAGEVLEMLAQRRAPIEHAAA